ncbi:hypothetical protein, conserved [Plasmodium ovale curtisi]|uniref:Uncharacterized protein n=1 Tax=Plasmodium ovale curtisi TaxID=864141 RepID=A0A1A8W5M9_PLAOA|nr:hypothetical protein, conserved [Plasmodium ovale curtisi]SBS96874.1 hypothetical protein, conserved [Plasmodium ovale curtisi]
MKVDPHDVFRNYNHGEAIRHIDLLTNEIAKKEDSIKEFLKEKSSHVIGNTIKIKNVYGRVERIKNNLENIVRNYHDLVSDIKDTTLVNYKELPYTREFNLFEKSIVKNVWEKKWNSYQFMFKNPFFQGRNKEGGRKSDGYHFVIKKKEELSNFDCFYLNNYINNIYFDINKKGSEEDYIYVINKIYTDIYICLNVLNSLLKKDEIKNVYMNIFHNKNSVKYLNCFMKKHKDNFCDILLKLIYSSFYNLSYNINCKIKTIPKCVIVLLLFFKKKNKQINDILKDDLFINILNARINLLNNFIQRKSSSKEKRIITFEKVKACFKKSIHLVLNSKYILLLLIGVRKYGKTEKENTLVLAENSLKSTKEFSSNGQDKHHGEKRHHEEEDKGEERCTCSDEGIYSDSTHGKKCNHSDYFSPCENNPFLRKMKSELFILQDPFQGVENRKMKKNKEFYNFVINSMNEINDIICRDSDQHFMLLCRNYALFVKLIYEYMIKLLLQYYNQSEGIIDRYYDLFKEYENIKLLHSKIKRKIVASENYFNEIVEDVDIHISNNHLNNVCDTIFEIFFFFFFNKFVSVIPFFDNKPMNKWKLLVTKFLRNLFSNLSQSHEKLLEIKNHIFYSFLLNSFYFYNEFYSSDVDLVYDHFCEIERGISGGSGKSFQREVEENYHVDKNTFNEKYFHAEFKRAIKEKINPLLIRAHKMIMFIESKEIKHGGNPGLLLMGGEQDLTSFRKLLDSFVGILACQTASPGEEEEVKETSGDISTSVLATAAITEADEQQGSEVKGLGRHSNGSEVEESTNEECKPLQLYSNLKKYKTKRTFNEFLKSYEKTSKRPDQNGPINFERKKELTDDMLEEPNFCFDDLKSIFFHIVYKIVKIALKSFCLDYFDNLEKQLYFYLNMLINDDVENVICEKMNCHLVNIFSFSNIFILYVEKVMNTDMHRDVLIFIVKSVLLKKVLQIYRKFVGWVREVHEGDGKGESVHQDRGKEEGQSGGKDCAEDGEKNGRKDGRRNVKRTNLLNKKVTELYNIVLLDLTFCEKILDKNMIVNKSFYVNLIWRYRSNERYYIQACFYFLDVYKETYNVYGEKENKHSIAPISDAEEEDATVTSHPLRELIDDILVELNKLDNLNSIIFQRHIRLLSQRAIKDSYFLYYLFVQGPALNNLLLNLQKDTEKKDVHVFNYNEVQTIKGNFIEDKLLGFFF